MSEILRELAVKKAEGVDRRRGADGVHRLITQS
jgi:hypothetical protein